MVQEAGLAQANPPPDFQLLEALPVPKEDRESQVQNDLAQPYNWHEAQVLHYYGTKGKKDPLNKCGSQEFHELKEQKVT